MAKFTPNVKKVETTNTPQSVAQPGNLKRAKNFLKEKKFVEALTEAELILQNDPSSFQAHLIAGRIKNKQKLDNEALNHYLTAIKINPKVIQAYLRAGKIYYAQKKYDSATKVFQAAIKQDPKNPVSYAALGQVSLKQEKYAEAEANYTKSIRLNPRFIPGRRGLAITCKEQSKYDDAIRYFNSILTIQSDYSGAYVGMGRIYLIQQKYSEAKEAYQQALQIKSSLKSSAYMGLIEALIQNNDLEEANKILAEISNGAQLSERLQKLWGDLYTRQGKYKEAAEAYQSAVLLSDQADDSSDLEEIDLLKDMDDTQWEALAKSYSAKAQSRVSQMRQGME